MIQRGLKLTSLRRDILLQLVPGRGDSSDELRRKVALARGLDPSSPAWPSFVVSFPRALRRLEELGAVELRRENVLFQKPCLSWVALTEKGARERARAGDAPLLSGLEPEASLEARVRPLLDRASDEELRAIAAAVSREWARRGRIA